MKRRFERWTLTSIKKQYDGTYNFRPVVVFAIIGLLVSVGLTQIGLAREPNATAAYFGGAGLILYLGVLIVGLQGPIIARYMDIDRVEADLRGHGDSPPTTDRPTGVLSA